MLHAKFQNYRTSGSGEEDFFKVFTINGHGDHLGHVTRTIYINVRSPFPKRFHIKFGFDWSSGSEKKTFEIVDGRTVTPDDAGRRTMGILEGSPMSLRLR